MPAAATWRAVTSTFGALRLTSCCRTRPSSPSGCSSSCTTKSSRT
uniref:Uncharacterized protein n=1 Tax=Anopheles atroparvus TaxID=41427 RepID=A0AAG5CQC0_ANOAO